MAIIKRPFRIKKADGSWEEHRFPTSEDMIVDAVQNLSGTGYRKLPGGLILQWGRTTNISDGQQILVTFPIAFPHAILTALGANSANPVGNNGVINISLRGLIGMDIGRYNGAGNACAMFWFAIGY